MEIKTNIFSKRPIQHHKSIVAQYNTYEIVHANLFSFESRYPSSSHTSFDISRYQSTSCEDHTSSFEIIDIDQQRGGFGDEAGAGGGDEGYDDKAHTVDLRKLSIELIYSDTVPRSGCIDRKPSLETHFDFEMPSPRKSPKLRLRRQSHEPNNNNKPHPSIGMKPHALRRSPLVFQTSSNYSSHDSYGKTQNHQFPSNHLLTEIRLLIVYFNQQYYRIKHVRKNASTTQHAECIVTAHTLTVFHSK